MERDNGRTLISKSTFGWINREFIRSIGEVSGIKIAAIISFTLIVLALVIIIKTPATSGYEISIYDVFPWYLWFFIIFAHFVGILILITNTFFKKESNFWTIGFLMIIISNSILLFMPLIRGYFIHGRHDVLTHIGYMVDIENNFNIGDNSYPMLHTLSVIIKYISGLNYNYNSIIIPALFSLFFIFSWYLLGKSIFKDKKQILLLLAFSSILILKRNHILISPNAETTLFIPFVLYLFFKSKESQYQSQYRTLLILVNIYIVFSHPLITILLVFTFLISDFTDYVGKNKNDSNTVNTKSNKIILIMLVIFLSWSAYLYSFVHRIELVADALFYNTETQSEVARYSDSINSIDIIPSEVLKIFMYEYGQFFILTILTIICIVITIIFWIKYNWKIDNFHRFSIFAYVFFSLLSLFFLTLIDDFGFMRIYSYAMFFSFILIPISINMIISKQSFKETKNHLKMLLIISLIFIPLIYYSTFSLFYAPINLHSNQQTSISEYSAIKTFYGINNESYPILELGIVNYRYHNLIHGVSKTMEKHLRYKNPIIDHFGYGNNSSLKNYYDAPSYLLIDDAGKYKPIKYYDESKDKFIPKDFVQLDADIGVIKIYSNKNFDIYTIDF